MKRISLIGLALVLLFILISSVGAEELHTSPYTSKWGDFKTVVPDGWKVTSDNEGTHYADTNFKSGEPYYSLSIRWYTRYTTHRLPSGFLVMYGSADDYISKTLDEFYGKPEPATVVRDVAIGDVKVKAFVVRSNKIRNREDWSGGLIGDEVADNPGEHAYTVISMPSGFYVLIYFAPQDGYSKYEKFYNAMVASFTRLKDGPGGSPLPGSPPPIGTAGPLQSASPQETLNQYVADLRGFERTPGGIDVAGRWVMAVEKDFHFIFEVRSNQLIATWVYDNEELAKDYGREKPFFSATLDGRKFSGRMSYYKFEGSSVSGSIDENNQKIEWTIPDHGMKDRVTRQGQSPSAQRATALRKKIIQHVSTMQPPPAIPDQAQRYFVQGNTMLKAAKNAADYKLAINKYKEALIEAPWWGDAYNNLAIALNTDGQTDDAKKAMELYILTKPKDAGQAQKKIYEIEAQQELQKERKKQFEQEVNLGVAAYGKGPDGYDEAIARWKKALELYPEQPEILQVYKNLMQVYYDRKNWDETLKYIQKVLELTPDNPEINGRMGYVLDMRGDLPKACIYYKKACDLGFQVSCNNRLKRCP